MTVSKEVSAAAKRKPPAAGKGRVKGTPNKMTKAIKDMILGALEDVGGQAYLARQAEENPGPFMTLLGKVLPTQLEHSATVPEELAAWLNKR